MGLSEAVAAIRKAKNLLALSGAGISAESGVPTFRGENGWWRRHRAEELATPEAFARDPKLVWEWYEERREGIAACQPNAAHRVLASWEDRFDSLFVVTQNVDGLHQRAGSKRMVELHGNIWQTRCTREGTIAENHQVPLPALPPVCPACGALLRPNIVWFGEGLPRAALQKAEELAEACDVMLVIGTSALVYPAADLPVLALEHGACVIEINPDQTQLSDSVSIRLEEAAGKALSRIDSALGDMKE
jgi:NAD-dependent deacetylase